MYIIELEKIEVFAYHGVHPEENQNGQIFFIDAVLEIDKDINFLEDDINKTTSYSSINRLIIKTSTEKTYKLIETLAVELVNKILDLYKEIKSVKIKVSKPSAPMEGSFKNVAVVFKKTRN
ncbi:MAG: dihydroneopterin aldolase [Oscillospiraceae bacterium]|nr:dihydroneopterin aldolase [Oscillospiraceae bacterium]